MNIYLIVANYILRGLVALTGVVLAVIGLWYPEIFPQYDSTMIMAFGAISFFWGVYRLLLFKIKHQRMILEQKIQAGS